MGTGTGRGGQRWDGDGHWGRAGEGPGGDRDGPVGPRGGPGVALPPCPGDPAPPSPPPPATPTPGCPPAAAHRHPVAQRQPRQRVPGLQAVLPGGAPRSPAPGRHGGTAPLSPGPRQRGGGSCEQPRPGRGTGPGPRRSGRRSRGRARPRRRPRAPPVRPETSGPARPPWPRPLGLVVHDGVGLGRPRGSDAATATPAPGPSVAPRALPLLPVSAPGEGSLPTPPRGGVAELQLPSCRGAAAARDSTPAPPCPAPRAL